MGNNNFKTVEADYPIIYFDNFLNKDEAKALCDEVEDFSNFDDLVMNGRNRVNKGSANFYKYLEKYPNVFKLYNDLNSEKNFLNFKNLLFREKKMEKSSWKPQIVPYEYSNDDYGEQRFNIFKYLRKTNIVSNFFSKKNKFRYRFF